MIFVGALFVSFSAMGQDYKPMLEEGKSWDVYYSAYDGEIGIVPYRAANRTYIVGDTIIDGMKWYKFASRSMISHAEVFYPPFSLSQEYVNEGSFMREDVGAQKVFGLFKDFETNEFQELLLYDFNVNVGDTVDLLTHDYINSKEVLVAYPYQCTAIVGLLLGDGEVVKSFEYESLTDPGVTEWFGPVVIIEGIGATGFWNPTNIGYDSFGCVKVGETILMSGEYGCNSIISSIPDYLTEKNILYLYPNPSKGIVQFPASIQFDKLNIYNTMGQVIEGYQVYTNGGKTFIEIDSELTRGVYFVAFYKDGAMHMEKLIIE